MHMRIICTLILFLIMKLESQTARANTVRMGSKFLASVKYKRTNVFCFKNRYTEVLMLMVKTDLANPGK